jgi:ArsR family transcriptional regulator
MSNDMAQKIQQEKLASQLWAIGDPMRLRLLALLPESPNCEHENNVSRLAEVLDISQPSVSHHLRILRQTGLVSHRKMCRDVFYWKNGAVLLEVSQAVTALTTTAAMASKVNARDAVGA